MISVASEMSRQPLRPNGRVSELPVQVFYVNLISWLFSTLAKITSFYLTGSNHQVLTLQASNLTLEDLTLTVLAPASFTSPPSVMTLNSAPSSPMRLSIGFSSFAGKLGDGTHDTAMPRRTSAPMLSENHKENGDFGAQSVSSNEQAAPLSDIIPNTGLDCTHLWLQSRVPLGYVPSQSTASIKLELPPLTDGIITLDTLQIDVKEEGSLMLISVI